MRDWKQWAMFLGIFSAATVGCAAAPDEGDDGHSTVAPDLVRSIEDDAVDPQGASCGCYCSCRGSGTTYAQQLALQRCVNNCNSCLSACSRRNSAIIEIIGNLR